jgi:uncharacterized protein (TIGR04141 family)
MAKAGSFSIYLLKQGYNAANVLRDDHNLVGQVHAANLPAGGALFVLDSAPMPPWWRGYFGIRKNLDQVHKGALVILPVNGRHFALSFGHVAHNLKEAGYEYDFGLRVTLNSVDPTRLRSTDILEPGAARRQRTQMPIESDLTYFDFDRDSTILRSLTGKVADTYRDLFRHATGASNLRISSNASADELIDLCERLLVLYQSENYKETFPEIQNVSPVKDPAAIAELNGVLLGSLRAKSEEVSLSVPDIINYQDNVYASFSGKGRGVLYDDIFIDRYYDYLESRGASIAKIELDDLRRHSLVLTDENGAPRERFSVYKSLIFDAQAGGRVFHLSEGQWYNVEPGYVEKLEKYLDPLCVDLALPTYNHSTEGEYNKAAAAGNNALICLDMENISPDGQTQIEPCDIYGVANGSAVFHHVKVSTHSSQLSHLFNQGVNSIELIKLEPAALQKLKQLVVHGLNPVVAAQMTKPLDSENYEVVFAIITHKAQANKSKNLPLFSRMSLMRNMRMLQLMSVKGSFGFVADGKPRAAGRKKTRKGKKA